MSVLLVPGFYGSKLITKYESLQMQREVRKPGKVRNRAFFTDIDPLYTNKRVREWTDEMSVRYHPESRTFLHSDELVCMQGLSSVRDMVPELGFLGKSLGMDVEDWIHELTGNRYFGRFIDRCMREGELVEGETLDAAPYDFRTILEEAELASYLDAVQSKIEALSGKTTLVSHSMGGILMIYFLTRHVNAAWKQEHIQSLFTVNTAFGGVPQALDVMVSGYQQIPTMQKVYGELMREYAGFALSLPNALCYDRNAPVFLLEKRGRRHWEGYSRADTRALSRKCGTHTYEIWRDLARRVLESMNTPTGVPTYNVMDTATSTGYQFYYREPTRAYHTEYCLGDGLVPLESLQVAAKMHGYPIIPLDGYGHMRILDAPELLERVLREVQRAAS